MILYDIGNSSIKRYENGKIERLPLDYEIKENGFYYISVNEKIKNLKNGTNISGWFNLQTPYKGLGIDRIAACYFIDTGVVIDAGSAITIDVMEKGVHKGGIILPGLKAYQKSFAKISPILDTELDEKVSLNTLPTGTKEAISFGVFKSIVSLVKSVSGEKRVYLTGGDGKKLKKFLENSVYKEDLLFLGMIKAIKEKDADNSPA